LVVTNKSITFAPSNQILTHRIMARPIRETPILTGEDAVRFMSGMQAVENLPIEVRSANRAAQDRNYQEAVKRIQICL